MRAPVEPIVHPFIGQMHDVRRHETPGFAMARLGMCGPPARPGGVIADPTPPRMGVTTASSGQGARASSASCPTVFQFRPWWRPPQLLLEPHVVDLGAAVHGRA